MEDRVVVWAPARDARLTCGFLTEKGFACVPCVTWDEFRSELQAGAGAAVIAAEFVTPSTLGDLEAIVSAQPPWSDLPVILVAGSPPAPELPDPFDALGNVAVLQRPLALDTLRSTVRAALRARRRQYQVRDLLQQKEEAERRKDEFLAMLAHELRNPLAPLRTGLQLLHLGPSAEIVARTHAMMERQIAHLTRLVDDLLDVSRITRRKIALKKRPLDLRECARQAVEAVRHVAAQKGIELELSVGPLPLIVQADSVRVEQMIGNLLGNALKFTPPRGTISVSASDEGGWAVVRVRDTGMGIPQDQLDRVFELFAQTARPLDRSHGGLGIGLTVVRLLAELHGGGAQIFSEGEGTGTEAVIRLPRVPATAGQALGAAPAARASECSRRILIVEDNHDVAEILTMYLEHVGHEVTVAYDGRLGLETALRDRPDVLICDIGLPGMTGYEIARRLRQEQGFDACLMIAITGYGEAADRERALAAGFSHHMTKPADPTRIANLIASASQAER